MRTLRTRSISTKVTSEEFAQFSALAGSRTMSEWAHDALLAAGASPEAAAILAELIALRTILLNMHYAVSTGKTLTPDAMQQVIARADEDKLRKAHERLATVGARGTRSPQS
jgi:hypothetical protein